MWVKQCHKPPMNWEWFILPIKMVISGTVYHIVLPTFTTMYIHVSCISLGVRNSILSGAMTKWFFRKHASRQELTQLTPARSPKEQFFPSAAKHRPCVMFQASVNRNRLLHRNSSVGIQCWLWLGDIYIWVNYNNSLTWIVGPFGDDFPY